MAEHLDIVLAIIGGALPALVWLSFWLREDTRQPEPRGLLVGLFLAGAFAVLPTYLLQELLRELWGLGLEQNVLYTILAWAASEELIKYLVVAALALSTPYFDEPVDALIYLITAALGFSAAENSLFMINALSESGSQVHFWLNGNLRFIGATILHVVTSSALGTCLALAFCGTKRQKFLATLAGLISAIALHSLFNYLIIKSGDGEVMRIFLLFWTLTIIVIYLFERIKRITCRLTKTSNKQE